jgi:hypothetical protein
MTNRLGLACFLSILAVAPPAIAADDLTPPALETLTFSPAAVDVTTGPATVMVTAHLTDDLSGVAYAQAVFASPSGQQSAIAYFSGPPVSGTITDGVYQSGATVAQFAEPGTWTLVAVSMYDKVGHYVTAFAPEFIAKGIATELVVTSIPDLAPPQLGSLTFSPVSVDTTAAPATVTVTAQFTDRPAGLAWAQAVFASPSGQHSATAYFGSSPVSGTIQDGVFQAVATVAQFVEPGTWKLVAVSMSDRAGNYITLFPPQLQEMGIVTDLFVASTPDLTPPELVSLTFSPSAVDVSSDPAAVAVSARIQDAPAGLAYAQAVFGSPSGRQSAIGYFNVPPVSGTINDGVYAASATVAQFAETGTWRLVAVSMFDRAGNYVTAFPPEFAAKGIATELVVGRPIVTVSIDIKPGSSTNPINAKARGTIPVAILSGAEFNAADLDPVSLTFGRTGLEASVVKCDASLDDVDGDGRLDRICHFDTQTAGFRAGDTQGFLRGRTIRGDEIRGADAVRIAP